MAINSLYNPSVLGVQRGLQNIKQTANAIAQQNVTATPDQSPDLSSPQPSSSPQLEDVAKHLVDLKSQKTFVDANVSVLQSNSRLVGTIIDTLA